jgi:hypothetical protein
VFTNYLFISYNIIISTPSLLCKTVLRTYFTQSIREKKENKRGNVQQKKDNREMATAQERSRGLKVICFQKRFNLLIGGLLKEPLGWQEVFQDFVQSSGAYALNQTLAKDGREVASLDIGRLGEHAPP